MSTTLVIILAVVGIALILIFFYNNLVKLRNNRINAFANIDVQLKQRFDLIPQLVATVKGYATHEKELLQRVTEARSAAMGAQTINDKVQADNQLSAALSGLKVSLEAYPDLKANTGFVDLQQKLTEIEKGLLNARKYYNAIAKQMNSKVEMFPSCLVASMTGFRKLPYAEVEEAAKARVEVKF